MATLRTTARGATPTGAGRLSTAVTGIAAVTLLTGAVQVLAPGWMLAAAGASPTRMARHLFGTVGMFMVVVGGLLLDEQAGMPDRRILLWTGLQKAGASAAVGLGVARGVFGRRALAVASFDLASAGLLLWYRRETG